MWPDTLPASLLGIRIDKGFPLLAKGHPASLLHPVPACFWMEAIRLAGSTPTVRARGSTGQLCTVQPCIVTLGINKSHWAAFAEYRCLGLDYKGNLCGGEARDYTFWNNRQWRSDAQCWPRAPRNLTRLSISASKTSLSKGSAIHLTDVWCEAWSCADGKILSVLCVTWAILSWGPSCFGEPEPGADSCQRLSNCKQSR